MFDTIKDVDYLFLAGARIFSRLGAPVSTVKIFAQVTYEGYRPRAERRSPQILHLPVGMPDSKC
jgi:hypothetical protein